VRFSEYAARVVQEGQEGRTSFKLEGVLPDGFARYSRREPNILSTSILWNKGGTASLSSFGNERLFYFF
jgi:hypothetical protein